MKKIVIIGGGIAGLSAGIYAQKAGFESIIYEKHTMSGGECTGWDRKGFHIDGTIHWLMGTKEGTGLNKIWKEVGALKDIEIYQHEHFVTVEYDGAKVTIHRDLEKLVAHLKDISPEDTEEIEKLPQYIKPFYSLELPTKKPIDMMNVFELLKFGASMREIGKITRKLGKLTVSEYIKRFKSPAIKEAFKSLVPEHYSAYVLFSSLGTFMSGNGGIPKGGSRALAIRMEDKYKNLGGKLILGTEVDEILIEQGVAKGVRLDDGTKEDADYIVPASDTKIVFEKLLRNKYDDKKFEMRYKDNRTYPLQTGVMIALSVDADLSSYPENYVFKTKEYQFENNQLNMLSIRHFSYEPSFAPEGKSVITVYFHGNYDWWKEKRQNLEAYKTEKRKLADEVVARIEEYFPELTGKLEMLDVATPITFERYTGAYKGSYMSFGPTPKGKQLMHNGKVKGIKNLFMAGQWLMPPGGLPTAVATGKWAIQRIAKQEKIQRI